MLGLRKITAIATLGLFLTSFSIAARPANGGREGITPEELKEWLAYLSSDELEGRNTFSEELGLAAAYIADQLKSWGVRPGGPSGSYFQRVAVLGVKSENHSTITIAAAGQKKTFENLAGVSFPAHLGSERVLE